MLFIQIPIPSTSILWILPVLTLEEIFVCLGLSYSLSNQAAAASKALSMKSQWASYSAWLSISPWGWVSLCPSLPTV